MSGSDTLTLIARVDQLEAHVKEQRGQIAKLGAALMRLTQTSEDNFLAFGKALASKTIADGKREKLIEMLKATLERHESEIRKLRVSSKCDIDGCER